MEQCDLERAQKTCDHPLYTANTMISEMKYRSYFTIIRLNIVNYEYICYLYISTIPENERRKVLFIEIYYL